MEDTAMEQPEEMAGAEAVEGMDAEQLEQIKSLFQSSYKVIYGDGAFDAMADQAEADGQVVPAVSQLTSKVIDTVIKQQGVTDVNVLLGLAIVIASDLLESLQQIGLESVDGDFEQILNNVVSEVLASNQQIAEQIKNDPEVQEMMAQAGGPEGAKADIATSAVQGDEMAQGVMGGAAKSQMEVGENA